MYYLRQEEYGKAEEYLSYLSDQDPEKKRKRAVIFSKTGCVYMLVMEDGETEKARMPVQKQKELAGSKECICYIWIGMLSAQLQWIRALKLVKNW